MTKFAFIIFAILLMFSFNEETVILNGVEVSSSKIVNSPDIVTGLFEGSFTRDIFRASMNTAYYNQKVSLGEIISFFNEEYGNDFKIEAISNRFPKPSYPTFGWSIGVFLGWVIISIVLLVVFWHPLEEEKT